MTAAIGRIVGDPPRGPELHTAVLKTNLANVCDLLNKHRLAEHAIQFIPYGYSPSEHCWLTSVIVRVSNKDGSLGRWPELLKEVGRT